MSNAESGGALKGKTSYSHREVLAYCVHNSASPRRLPAPPLLMFDQVLEIHAEGGKHGSGYLVAEKNLRFDEWFFFSHFQGDPVMPGVLELDGILQLAGFFLMHLGHDGYGRALRMGRIIFREQVRPHHRLVKYRIDFRKVTARPTPIAVADAFVEVDGKVSVEIENLMTGLFANLQYQYP
ncbi:MAG: bifunctional 3-hydroxydecanoyl-ACP dehydratase/trans-2-decenoyl-ACP isomerase [Planctomycetes bacterium]|nr:bifunctional 3-hydroxydecanoyl-ACP dehydratase/trans-2-decenoyl-ACP isomerase [Planctomycetota bacterium]